MNNQILTLHVRKDMGHGRAHVKMYQAGRVWHQLFNPVSGAGRVMRAGFYTGSLRAMEEMCAYEGWKTVNFGLCEPMEDKPQAEVACGCAVAFWRHGGGL